MRSTKTTRQRCLGPLSRTDDRAEVKKRVGEQDRTGQWSHPTKTLACASCYGILSWLLLGSVCLAQYGQNAAPTGAASQPTQGRAAGDPAIVRPSGYSVQPNATNTATTPQVQVQPNGQRVFTQNTAPLLPPERINERTDAQSPVQPASWSADTAIQTADKPKTRTPIELKPSKSKSPGVDKPTSTWAAGLSMFFSLVIVLCLFLMIAWLFRKTQPGAFMRLPTGVVQVMGRTAMAPRQQVYVVRFGNKLLLVSHQPGQTQTLCEITDTDEVNRLSGMCEANQPNSATHSFRDVLKQVASGRADADSGMGSRRKGRVA